MLKKIFIFFKTFKRKPTPILLDNEMRLIPAFEWGGETYYMHEDPLNIATGRGLTAMIYMEELLMRCSSNYLKLHVEACDKIFTDPKKTDLPALIKLHSNLKERVNLHTAFPEHVYKMASVVFFTKVESAYRYDAKFNEAKIAAWREAPDIYDFFLQTPLKDLIPFLSLPESNSKGYLMVLEKINQIHLQYLHEFLSKNISITDT